jgi:hypothetical protein
VVALLRGNRRIDLRALHRRLASRVWAWLSPYSRWLYPLVRRVLLARDT